MLSNWIKYYNVFLTWSALYTSLVSFEVLLLSKAHWIISSDQRSIKISVASLLHNLPRFFDAISFFPRKAQDFGASKAHFRPQSLRIRGQSERKDSGDENSNSFGTRTSFLGGPRLPPEVVSARLNFSARGPKKFAFTRQKSSVPCPILLARVPRFRSAVPKMNVV